MNKLKHFLSFLNQLFWLKPVLAFSSLIVNLFLGVFQGISLLLILPFLSILGILNNKPSKLTNYVNNVFDFFAITPDLKTLLVIFSLLIMFFAIINYANARLNGFLVKTYNIFLTKNLYEKIIGTNHESFIKIKQSDYMNILTQETNKITNGVRQSFTLITSVIILSVNLLASYLVSPPLTIIVVIVIVMLFILQRSIFKGAYATGRGSFLNQKKIYLLIKEQLESLKLSKTFNNQNQQVKNFETILNNNHAFIENNQKLSAISGFVVEVLGALVLSVLIYLSIEVYKTSSAELLLLIYIFSRTVPKLSSLFQQAQAIVNMLPAIKAYTKIQKYCIKHKEVDIEKGKIGCTLINDIYFEKVSFNYANKNEVLKEFSCKITANKLTVIHGESGSGKSTIIDLLLGFIKPNKGVISIDNENLNNISIKAWRNKIGYVPQESYLYNTSIRENLKWAFTEVDESQIWIALDKAGAKSFVEKLPKKLDTLVGDRGNLLSGGERQRLAIARALINNPEILIFDEPTSGLDIDNTKRLIPILKSLKNVTIIIVSHDDLLYREADNTIFL